MFSSLLLFVNKYVTLVIKKLIMLKILLIMVLGSPSVIDGQISANNLCKDNSECIPLSECPEVKRMVNNDALLNFARSLLCGYFHEPLVCCDRNCVTPNGNFGQAKDLNDCPDLKSNEYSREKSKRDFLLESRTGDANLVCCNAGEDDYRPVLPPPKLITARFFRPNSPACTTPNGEIANCISIDECDSYKNVATDTDENFRYINDSYCGYWEKPMICCGIFHLYTQAYSVNLPENFECGKWNAALNPDIPPWLAVIQAKDSDKSCVGALINKEYVLSTTACIGSTKNIEIKIGKCINEVTGNECNFRVLEVKTFPLYRYHLSKDTGMILLKLSNPLKMGTADFSPVCLPDDVLAVYEDIELISGERQGTRWIGKQTSLQTRDNADCHNEFHMYLERIICLRSNDICSDNKHSLLHSLVLRKGKVDQWYLEGLINEEECYGNDGKSFFHAISVHKFLPWIKSNIK